MSTELVPVWNGAMEAAGMAPGLSSYNGRSSIYHSANWERMELFEKSEAQQYHARMRVQTKQRTLVTPALAAEILALLRTGVSYGFVRRKYDVTDSVPRRIARRAGISRAALVPQRNQFHQSA